MDEGDSMQSMEIMPTASSVTPNTCVGFFFFFLDGLDTVRSPRSRCAGCVGGDNEVNTRCRPLSLLLVSVLITAIIYSHQQSHFVKALKGVAFDSQFIYS